MFHKFFTLSNKTKIIEFLWKSLSLLVGYDCAMAGEAGARLGKLGYTHSIAVYKQGQQHKVSQDAIPVKERFAWQHRSQETRQNIAISRGV